MHKPDAGGHAVTHGQVRRLSESTHSTALPAAANAGSFGIAFMLLLGQSCRDSMYTDQARCKIQRLWLQLGMHSACASPCADSKTAHVGSEDVRRTLRYMHL